MLEIVEEEIPETTAVDDADLDQHTEEFENGETSEVRDLEEEVVKRFDTECKFADCYTGSVEVDKSPVVDPEIDDSSDNELDQS